MTVMCTPRRPGWVLRMGCLGLVILAGCSETMPWHTAARPASSKSSTELEYGAVRKDEAGESSADIATDLGKESRGFFRPDRRAGALSSEAREIEASLGVR